MCLDCVAPKLGSTSGLLPSSACVGGGTSIIHSIQFIYPTDWTENLFLVSYQSSELSISKERSRECSGWGRGISFSRFTLSVLWKLCTLSAFCLDIPQRVALFLRTTGFSGGFFLGSAGGPGTKASEFGWRLNCDFSIWYLAAWDLHPPETFLSVKIDIQIYTIHISAGVFCFVQSCWVREPLEKLNAVCCNIKALTFTRSCAHHRETRHFSPGLWMCWRGRSNRCYSARAGPQLTWSRSIRGAWEGRQWAWAPLTDGENLLVLMCLLASLGLDCPVIPDHFNVFREDKHIKETFWLSSQSQPETNAYSNLFPNLETKVLKRKCFLFLVSQCLTSPRSWQS